MHEKVSLSSIMDQLIVFMENKQKVPLNDCIELFGTRGIVIVLLFFALLNSIPLPSIPGFSTVTGIPIILLGLQLAFAAKTLWLPKRVREYQIDCTVFRPRLQKLEAKLKKWEHVLKPRWLILSEPPIRNVLGILVVCAAIILALPIPFFNFPAGLAISILAVGLIEEDGFVITLGIALVVSFMCAAVGLTLL